MNSCLPRLNRLDVQKAPKNSCENTLKETSLPDGQQTLTSMSDNFLKANHLSDLKSEGTTPIYKLQYSI